MLTFKQKVLFTNDECIGILDLYSKIKPTGNQIENGISYTYKNIDCENTFWILERFINWIESEVDCKVDWLASEKRELYLQTYIVGDEFHKHKDDMYNREYTAGLLLNNSFEGGEFVVDISKDIQSKFNNIVGNCYLFDSKLLHQLKPITNGERNIVLLFFKKSQIKYKKIQLI
jgi:hypothetical protein